MQQLKKDTKLVRSLHQKKFRKELNLFVVEGKKVVEESLESQFQLHSIYSTDPDFVQKHGAIQVTAKEMEMMSSFNTPSGYLAVLHAKQEAASDVNASVIIALDGVSDPGNLGTIIRTADWFGFRQLLLSAQCVEVFNPKVVQSTMGSIFRVQVEYTDLKQKLIALQSMGYQVYGADLGGKNLYTEKFNSKTVIVLGSESHGISREVHEVLSSRVSIPGGGGAESLNVAVAGAIILSHLHERLI